MTPRVLHAIVGHKLPTYFLNAVRSVRGCAPQDDLVVVDNASRLPELTQALELLAADDPKLRLIARDRNEQKNLKVGGLYAAYNEVLTLALGGDYELLHLIQADMQMVWWGEEAVDAAMRLFERHPTLVNIHTSALPRARRHSPDVIIHPDGTVQLVGYGVTDTGLYHLARWRGRRVTFADSEQAHARFYYDAGLRVFCHPVPPVCPLPWPAVVRDGDVHGTEVKPVAPYLLRPLDQATVRALAKRGTPAWLEDVCAPWGWKSLMPAWPTAVETIDVFVDWFRELRFGGQAARPRWVGVELDQRGRRIERRPRARDILGRFVQAQVARRRRTANPRSWVSERRY